MNPFEKELMQTSIEKIYGDFVSKVASGRKMDEEKVDSIGQGRVWSGTSAMTIGLIDEMGGLKDAISGAAKLANIESYAVRELPELEDPYTRILTELAGEMKIKILKNELGESVKIYNLIHEVKDMTGIQARLPYFIDIH
jgi:protease-4